MINVNPELMIEKYNKGTLSYILLKSGLLSSTEYKVLQKQEHLGYARCFRVVDNGRDKLVYETEGCQTLSQTLPTITADNFLITVAKIINAVTNLQGVGFLDVNKIVFIPNSVFISADSLSIRLIYLPLSVEEKYISDGMTELKNMILNIIDDNNIFYNNDIIYFRKLLADTGTTLENLRQYLYGHIIQNMETEESLVSSKTTDDISTSSELKDSKYKTMQTDSMWGKFNIFGKRNEKKDITKNCNEHKGTAILGKIFVPSIMLECVGTQKKIELVINKQNYIIGKKKESVDGCIEFSNAVSRIHCRIDYKDGNNYITDLNSANGTFLNDKKLSPDKPYVLRENDLIKMADITLTVREI